MLLRTVRLQNIRSYGQPPARISIEPGFTCITGGIGQGKSTILLAVDFALTGKPLAGNYQYLLRESESRGVVEIEFENGDHTVRIHRVLERLKDEIRQKSDECWIESDGRIIAKGKLEPINASLATLTGIDPEVLREVAWIKQERLKLLLNLRREERQVLLDGLLGLEEIRKIAEGLGEAERFLSQRISRLERESGGLEDDLRDLDRKKLRQSSLEGDLNELNESLRENQRRLSGLEASLSEIKSRADEFESQRREISVLQQRLLDLEQSLKKNQGTLKRQIERRTDLEEKLRTEEERIAELQAKYQKLGFRDPLTRESLNASMRNLRTRKEQLLKQLTESENLAESLRRNLAILQDREKCPVCYQDIPPVYRSTILQQLYTDLGDKETEVSRAKNQYEGVEGEVTSLEALLETFNSSSVENYRSQLEDVQQQIKDNEKEIDSQKREHTSARVRLEEGKELLRTFTGLSETLRKMEDERDRQFQRVANEEGSLRSIAKQRKEYESEIASLDKRIEDKKSAQKEVEERRRGLFFTQRLRDFLKGIRPRLRGDFLDDLQIEVQRVLDEVRSSEDPAYVELDEFYTPSLIMNGQRRTAEQLSGGERTLLAFTLNVGLAQLVYELKTHQSLDILLLDEPTESLGTEDDSIQKLAETIRSMRSIQQIIAVTHSEDFAQHADHIISVTKQLNQSKIEALT